MTADEPQAWLDREITAAYASIRKTGKSFEDLTALLQNFEAEMTGWSPLQLWTALEFWSLCIWRGVLSGTLTMSADEIVTIALIYAQIGKNQRDALIKFMEPTYRLGEKISGKKASLRDKYAKAEKFRKIARARSTPKKQTRPTSAHCENIYP
jgi:hypothetical protein